MPKDNRVYVEHILDRAQKIIKFTDGMDEVAFISDEKTQSAVIRELEVIGEAAKKITLEFREQHPAIPWKIIAGMRDVLIHDYEGVNPLRVWDTIQNDIPALISQIKRILHN